MAHRGQERKLYISYVAPHNHAWPQTIARWFKDTLTQAGADTTMFNAHSTKVAAASATQSKGCPIDNVIEAGRWSHVTTFAKYYGKAVSYRLVLQMPFLRNKCIYVQTKYGANVRLFWNLTWSWVLHAVWDNWKIKRGLSGSWKFDWASTEHCMHKGIRVHNQHFIHFFALE